MKRAQAARSATVRRKRTWVRIPIASRGLPDATSGESRASDVILAAALRLYGQEGYAAVTIRALAREIGCSPGALYTHFLDKGEIIGALQARGLRLFADAALSIDEADPIEALRRHFLVYYEFSKAHPEYFTLLWVDRVAPGVAVAQPDLHRAIEFGHGLAERCLREGAIPPGLTPETITKVLWSAVHGAAVLRHLANGAPGHEGDVLAASVLELSLAGLRAGVLTTHRRAAPLRFRTR